MELPEKLSFTRQTWRVICHAPAPGAWNMAVDEAILESAGSGAVLPTLRLYAWQPACLSLGYAQPSADIDLAALEAHGWQWVRRPTGGRAILHIDELTYSVCAPHNEPRLAGSVLESYRVLAQALLQALQRLGIAAEALEKTAQPAVPARQQNPVCFEVPSNYEITVGGKKLIGSAQARRKEGVLQHGSLPLYGELERISQVLQFEKEADREKATRRLAERATTAERALGHALDWETTARAFQAAFADCLNLELTPGGLTLAETRRAEVLLAEKYANPAWLRR